MTHHAQAHTSPPQNGAVDTALPCPAPPVPDLSRGMPPARKALYGDLMLGGRPEGCCCLCSVRSSLPTLRGPVLVVPAALQDEIVLLLEEPEGTGQLLLVPLRRESPWRRLSSESHLGQLWRKLENFWAPAAHSISGTVALPAWSWCFLFVGILCLLPFICSNNVRPTGPGANSPSPHGLVSGCSNTLFLM